MVTRTFRTASSVLGLIGFVALAPTPAFAQQDNGGNQAENAPIIVTAQRRKEKQVDVPISITALGEQQLQTANVQNLADISKVTPGLRFDNQTGFFQPSIRGIGTGITTSGGGSNVGIYIDGFYSPNPLAADFQLTKVTSIQVLKGPQGTLFGHNTTGGAILVTTADPSEKPEVDLKASIGRFGHQRYQAYTTFGVAPGVAVDLEGMVNKGHGFITNIVDGNNHVGAYQNWTIRTGVKFQLSDRVSVLARYQHARMDDPSGQMLNSNTDTTINPTTGKPWGIQTFTVPGTYTTNPDQIAANAERFIRSNTNIAQLTIKADLGFANLTSYSQFRKEDVNQSEDLDQTALPIFQLGLPVHDKTWSQEFLLTSKPGPRLQWTTGFFFLSNKDTYITTFRPGTTLLSGPVTSPIRLGGSSTTTQTFAGYLDLTYRATDKLFLTAGVRYSHDQVVDAYWNTALLTPYYVKDGQQIPAPNGVVPVPSIHSNHATPRVVVRYKPTDDSSIYASYSRGYKAAIIDVGGSCQDGPPAGNYTCNPIKPETVDAFEVGYKFDNRVISFHTSAFYYNYRNLQVSEFLGNAQAFIVNAAKSEIYGIDAELHANLGEHFEVNLGGSWTHARYKRFGGQVINGQVVGAPIYATCPGGLAQGCYAYVISDASTVLHNVHMQHTPDFTGNAGARYHFFVNNVGEFSLSGNLYYTSAFYFSPSGTQFRQPGYATLALRAQWQDPTRRYMLALYGENVTDKRYRTQVQYNGFGIGASWSQPASWGIEAGVKF